MGEELKIKEKENNRKMKRVREGATRRKDGQSGVKRKAPSLVGGIGDITIKGSKNKYLIKTISDETGFYLGGCLKND